MDCFSCYKIVVALFINAGTVVYSFHFQDEEPCNNSLVIAFTGYRQIGRYDFEAAAVTALTPTTQLDNAIAIAADQRAGLVFFTDVQQKRIYVKDFKTPRNALVIRYLSADSVPDGIAVDTTIQRIFYTDAGEDVIASMDYEGRDHVVLMTSAQGLQEPRAIVLDTANSKMYYTDWGSDSHIARADYTGRNREVLQNTDLVFPNGMTADFTAGKLYWCDAGLDTVSVMNLDGTERQTLYTREDIYIDLHFFDLTLIHEDLIISEWNYRAVYRLHREGGGSLLRLLQSTAARPNGLAEICFAVSDQDNQVLPTASLSTLPATSLVTSSSTASTTRTSSAAATSSTTTVSGTATAPSSTATSSTTATSSPTSSTAGPEPGPSSEKSKQSDQGDGLSDAMIIVVALVIGAVLVISAIIAISIVCCIKLCRKTPRDTSNISARYNADGASPPPYTGYLDLSHVKRNSDFSDPTYNQGSKNNGFVLDTGDYIHPMGAQRSPESGEQEGERNSQSGIYMSLVIDD